MLSMLAALCPIAMMKTGLRDNRIGPLHGDVPPDVEFGVAAAPWPA